jgi:signal peptide peptidase SppA
MKYPRILVAIRSAKWAVTPVTLQAIRDSLSARLTGKPSGPLLGDMDYDDDGDGDLSAPPFEIVGPGIARVEMHGIIGKNLSRMEMMCGGCDLARIEENLAAALAAPSVLAVILDIDSPGGCVGGVGEFAECIGEMSAACGKPVIAYASGQCCSAAYWIACGCAQVICSPSSDVGSIGVYMAMVDESANWQEEGYKLVLIKAGENKAAGMPGSVITPEQVALWQADVDFIYAQFTGFVRAARPGIEDSTMQGQTFYGPRALAVKLVDKVLSLEDAIDEFAPVMRVPAA